MSMIKRWSRIWRNVVHRRRMDEDLDAELTAYIDLLTDQKIAAGLAPEEARRAARVEAEGLEQTKEAVRDVRTGALLDSLLRDARFALRLLARNRAFTVTALFMLAIGIGANTAVFSVLNALVLRGLPYSSPEKIVALYEKRPREGNMRVAVSGPDFLDWRSQSTSFESIAATFHTSVTWQPGNGAERIPAAIVSPELFDVYAPLWAQAFPRIRMSGRR
jgi:hypothetical protein